MIDVSPPVKNRSRWLTLTSVIAGGVLMGFALLGVTTPPASLSHVVVWTSAPPPSWQEGEMLDHMETPQGLDVSHILWAMAIQEPPSDTPTADVSRLRDGRWQVTITFSQPHHPGNQQRFRFQVNGTPGPSHHWITSPVNFASEVMTLTPSSVQANFTQWLTHETTKS